MKGVRASLAGAVIAGGVGLAACGGGGTTSAPAAHAKPFSLVDVYQASDQSGGARFAGEIREQLGTKGSGAEESAAVTMSGLLDLHTQEAKLQVKIPTTGPITMLLVDQHLYVHVPATGAPSLPAGTQWVSVDLQQLAQASGAPGLNASSENPSDLFSVLEARSDSVEPVGTRVIRGVQTTRYRAVLDLNKEAASDPSAAQSLQRAVAMLHTSTLPVAVWVDGQQRVRRLSFSFHIPAGSPSPSGGTVPTDVSVQLTFDLFDYGVPVQVTAPTSGVYDVTSQIQSSTTTTAP